MLKSTITSVKIELRTDIGKFVPFVGTGKLFPTLHFKKIGKELFFQGAPELVDVITKRKSPKQTARETVRKTVAKQLGRGRKVAHLRKRKRMPRKSTNVQRKHRRSTICRKRKAQRSWDQFFSKLKNDY